MMPLTLATPAQPPSTLTIVTPFSLAGRLERGEGAGGSGLKRLMVYTTLMFGFLDRQVSIAVRPPSQRPGWARGRRSCRCPRVLAGGGPRNRCSSGPQ